MITEPEFQLLKKYRNLIGIEDEQAEILELLSQKPEISWSDLAAVLKGELITKQMAAEKNTEKKISISHQPSESAASGFHPERPCSVPSEHIGREDIVYNAFSRLATDDLQSFAVIGFYKEGKTSLLNYIMNPSVQREYLGEKAEKYSFVYMDLKDRGIHFNVKAFFREFYESVSRALHTEVFQHVRDDLPRINEYLVQNDRRLVVVLDNFNLVINNKKNFPVQFYDGLRSWFSNTRQVGCVLSSPIRLLSLSMSEELSGSPFFNIFDSYTLYPLNRAEAIRLLETGLPGELRRQRQEIETLIGNFGCSPYPLQVAGKAWTDCFQKKEEKALETAIETAYRGCLHYYEEVYASFSNKQLTNITGILNPRQKSSLPIDNSLIDRGLVKKIGGDAMISSSQLERFLREKLDIQPKSPGIFAKIKSIFQK